MNNNIRVGNLFGIPFYINPSWFLVLALMTFSYGGQLALFPQLGGIIPWLLGLVASLLLFASVLAHELGHSFVAIAQGIKVKSITLFLFGGLASLEKESDTPLQSFLIAIAGPLVSLFLFALLTVIGANLSRTAPLAAIVSLLASINLILGLFNLIPGLPLDGGNILKAAVWQFTGNPNKGVLFASRFGQLFGWLGVIVGGLGSFNILPFGSFWTLLIGWFLLQNAGRSAQFARVNETLANLTAEDAIDPDSPIVRANLNLREFANQYVIGQQKWNKFLVIDEQGKLLGAIAVNDMKNLPTSEWPNTRIGKLLIPVTTAQVEPNISLLEVATLMEQQNLQELTVVEENGILVGLVEKTSIINLLQKQAQPKVV